MPPRTRRSGAVLGPTPGADTMDGMPARPAPRSRGLAGGLAGSLTSLGPRGYLYLLVLLEVGLIGFLRHVFRNSHGG